MSIVPRHTFCKRQREFDRTDLIECQSSENRVTIKISYVPLQKLWIIQGVLKRFQQSLKSAVLKLGVATLLGVAKLLKRVDKYQNWEFLIIWPKMKPFYKAFYIKKRIGHKLTFEGYMRFATQSYVAIKIKIDPCLARNLQNKLIEAKPITNEPTCIWTMNLETEAVFEIKYGVGEII
jgi:hypothetical protein